MKRSANKVIRKAHANNVSCQQDPAYILLQKPNNKTSSLSNVQDRKTNKRCFFQVQLTKLSTAPNQVSALGTAEASFKTLTTDFYKVTQ